MSDQDPELQAIRAARLAQLQKGGGPQGGRSNEQEQEERQKELEMKRDMLATILDSNARERLARIAIVNPKLSGQIEAIIFRTAQSGQLRARMTEEQLIALLEQAEEVHSKSASNSTISFQRRKAVVDDDFDL